jgi:hypothetical protein
LQRLSATVTRIQGRNPILIGGFLCPATVPG